jgi:Domain of unknown function (DUF4259)
MMGAWGTGLFEDDLALDIKLDFESYMDEGISMKEIIKRIIDDYEEEINDKDEGPIVYLVLAALQLEHNHGKVYESIKKKAIDIIDQKQGLLNWRLLGEEAYLDRLDIMSQLKQQLTTSKRK